MPAVIATGNLFWCDFYRHGTDPYAGTVEALRRLYESWKRRPSERRSVEEEMRQVAVEVVGESPDDLLDVVV